MGAQTGTFRGDICLFRVQCQRESIFKVLNATRAILQNERRPEPEDGLHFWFYRAQEPWERRKKIEDILEETLGMREFSRKKALYATSFEAFSTSKNRQFVYELVISSSRDSVRDTAPKVGSQSMDRGETGG